MTSKLLETKYLGYWAGSDGHIYSTRTRKDKYGKPPYKLKANPGKTSPYLHVNISGVGTKTIHTLICETYHGSCPQGLVASHVNGNYLDNRPDNLMWETQSDNLEKKFEHGTGDSGYNNSRAKLTEEDLVVIRSRLAAKERHHVIAKDYEVSRTVITRINSGTRYGRV